VRSAIDVAFAAGEDAKLTPLNSLTNQGENDDYVHYTALAVNPVDGVVYAFDDDAPGVWTISLDFDEPDFIGFLDDSVVLGADFDRSGQLWLSVYSYSIPTLLANASYLQLATFDFATDQPVVVDRFSSADPYEIDESESITVWGVLAATGSSVDVAPAIAASGILLLGALLAAGTMVLRRRNADAL
jgi:hypothetical protein